MADIVVIEDALIAKMLRSPAITAQFPFLKTAAAKYTAPRRCGGCARKNRARGADFDGLKRAIGHLPKSELAKLKGLLKAKQVTVTFRNGQGGRTKLKF